VRLGEKVELRGEGEAGDGGGAALSRVISVVGRLILYAGALHVSAAERPSIFVRQTSAECGTLIFANFVTRFERRCGFHFIPDIPGILVASDDSRITVCSL
jgi:hypothetical protein